MCLSEVKGGCWTPKNLPFLCSPDRWSMLTYPLGKWTDAEVTPIASVCVTVRVSLRKPKYIRMHCPVWYTCHQRAHLHCKHWKMEPQFHRTKQQQHWFQERFSLFTLPEWGYSHHCVLAQQSVQLCCALKRRIGYDLKYKKKAVVLFFNFSLQEQGRRGRRSARVVSACLPQSCSSLQVVGLK